MWFYPTRPRIGCMCNILWSLHEYPLQAEGILFVYKVFFVPKSALKISGTKVQPFVSSSALPSTHASSSYEPYVGSFASWRNDGNGNAGYISLQKCTTTIKKGSSIFIKEPTLWRLYMMWMYGGKILCEIKTSHIWLVPYNHSECYKKMYGINKHTG